MLCYIYCSLAAAYAESMLSKNAAHLNSHKDAFCVLASFRVRSSKEAWQDRSPRERKSVFCVLGIEKQISMLNGCCFVYRGYRGNGSISAVP